MKNAFRRLLPKNNFARHVAVLVGGTAAGRVIVIAASPLLTRLYTPDDFGLLGVFASLLAIGGVIASLRYQLAIPLPESDKEAASISVLSLLIVLGMTLLSAIGLALWGAELTALTNTPALTPYLWLLPLGLLLLGTYQVLNYWAIRTKAFTAIARTKLSQSIGMVVVQVGGYILGPVALLFGRVTGQAAGSTGLAIRTIRPSWHHFKQVRAHDVRYATNRWRRFPIYSTWGGLFNSAGVQLPTILFAALFSPAAAGIYMLAQRVLTLPMQLLGQAIAQVFFSSSAEAKRKGELAPLVANVHEKLAQVAMPPMLILVLAGPDLFAFVFGENWREAGQFAQWMAPWLYLVFVSSPLSQLFSVLEKQAQSAVFQTILFVSRIASLFIGAALGGLLLTVALYSISSALCWAGFLVWLINASGNTWSVLMQPALKALSVSVLVAVPVILYYALAHGLILWLIALAVSAVLLATRYTVILKKAW